METVKNMKYVIYLAGIAINIPFFPNVLNVLVCGFLCGLLFDAFMEDIFERES